MDRVAVAVVWIEGDSVTVVVVVKGLLIDLETSSDRLMGSDKVIGFETEIVLGTESVKVAVFSL